MKKEFTKYDVIHHLSKKYGYKNYLELCTTTTGNFYRKLDPSLFSSAHRMMYKCPPEFEDSLPIDYRSPDNNIESCIEKLKINGVEIDICLVDGWHTYDNAKRDLSAAYDLIIDGGVLVVHDCLPPNIDVASPQHKIGEWCGVSYKAYLDFIFENNYFDYCTVDCDYGCGIIVKNRRTSTRSRNILSNLAHFFAKPRHNEHLANDWLAIGDNYDASYASLQNNKNELLRLIDCNKFLNYFRIYE